MPKIPKMPKVRIVNNKTISKELETQTHKISCDLNPLSDF